MINFAKYATKQCECSHGVNQFICTSKNCKKSPLVCSDCFFDEHHDHSNFCIPINRYKMQQLAPKFYETIVNYSKTLTTIKEQIATLFQDEINFVNNINDLNEEKMLELNFLPKFNYPPASRKEYIVNSFSSEFLIVSKLRNNIKQIQNKLNIILNQALSFFNKKELEIKISSSLLDNEKLYDNINNDHTINFTINTQKKLTLTGIGFNPKIFKEIQNAKYSLNVNSIQIFQNSTYTNLTSSNYISTNQSGNNFVKLNPIILKNKAFNNMITLEIRPDKTIKKNNVNTGLFGSFPNQPVHNPSTNLFAQPVPRPSGPFFGGPINLNYNSSNNVNSNESQVNQNKPTTITIEYSFPESYVFNNMEMNCLQSYLESKPYITQLFLSEISDEVE